MDAIRSRVKHPYIVGACAVGIVLGLAALGGLLAHRGGEEAGVEAGVNATSNGTRNGMEAGVEAGVNGSSNGTRNWMEADYLLRIIGGRPVLDGEAPEYLGSFGTPSQHMCHALLVLPRIFWTTGECMTAVMSYGLKLTINRTNLDDDSQGQTRKVIEFKVHPKWNPDNPIIRDRWMHNLAVGKLDEDIEGIQYACMAAAGSVIPAGTPAVVFGYGRTGTSQVLKPPRRMQVANVSVSDLQECKRIHKGKVKDNMVCAANEAGGQNICQGDSGAPLMVDGAVVAINIRGPPHCNTKNNPPVFQMLGDPFLTDATNQMTNKPPPCGIRKLKTPDLRVGCGDYVQPHSWPWLVWLEGENGEFFYGGALLDEYHVLTTWGRHWPGFYVVIGGHILSSTTESRQKIKVEKVTRIPGSLEYHRLALVELSEPVKWKSNIRPICLPDPDLSLPAGTKCVLAGWGGYPWEYLKEIPTQAELSIVTSDYCLAKFDWPHHGYRESIRDHNVICTFPVMLDIEVSKDDEGGALMCEKNGRWYAYGTLLWTGPRGRPHLFYRNPVYVQRINEEMSPHLPTPVQVCYKKFEG